MSDDMPVAIWNELTKSTKGVIFIDDNSQVTVTLDAQPPFLVHTG